MKKMFVVEEEGRGGWGERIDNAEEVYAHLKRGTLIFTVRPSGKEFSCRGRGKTKLAAGGGGTCDGDKESENSKKRGKFSD